MPTAIIRGPARPTASPHDHGITVWAGNWPVQIRVPEGESATGVRQVMTIWAALLRGEKIKQFHNIALAQTLQHLWQLWTGRIADMRGESAACQHGHSTEAEAREIYSVRLRASSTRRMSHLTCLPANSVQPSPPFLTVKVMYLEHTCCRMGTIVEPSGFVVHPRLSFIGRILPIFRVD